MDFDLHRIKKIYASKIDGNDRVYWREIVFELENGEKLNVNVFANEQKNLIIKKEK